MWRTEWDQFITLLNEKVVSSLGCTEPVSTAYAAALATELLGRRPDTLEVLVSGNLLKNGMGVAVPGTGMCGLPIAAAVGAIAGDPKADLEVLKNITNSDVSQAKAMLDNNRVTVSVKDVPEILYTEVIASSGEDTARIVVKNAHTRVVLKEWNGQTFFETGSADKKQQKNEALETTVSGIYDFAINAPLARLSFIRQTAVINSALSAEGLSKDYGLQVGASIQRNLDRGYLTEDLTSLAMMRASAASDARMDGAMLPAMSCFGSGNQGIAASMPVVAVAEKLKASDEQLIRALILSHLITIHLKTHVGALSAMCIATTAGAGASAAIAYLLGGNLNTINNALFNVMGDISGVFCDGAKASCSLKVSTSASTAVKASMMALDGIRVTCNEGIIEDGIEKTIDNLGMLGSQGLKNADEMILKIMTEK